MCFNKDISDKNFILLGVIVIILVGVVSYIKLDSLDTFTIGTVNDISRTSKGHYRLYYHYKDKSHKREGVLKNPSSINEAELISKKFLVAYNPEKPERSYLFLERPADNISVDSLNKVLEPSDILTFWMLISQ